jgi:uncharacterized protein (UPF0548 family)
MFLFSRPSDRDIRQFLSKLAESDYSYADAGATASAIPQSYNVDHNRVQLGSGAATWELAVDAIKKWEMFNLGWVRLCWPDTPICPASNVAILVKHFGFYSLNGARIVYVTEQHGPISRFGFAYGTLTDHAESGEERFMVEWNQQDNSVFYDLLAFSKPNHQLAQLGFPLARHLQKSFAADSKAAMLAWVSNRLH